MTAESPLLPSLLDMQLLVTVVVAGGWWALYRPMLEQAHYRWWAWGWTAFLAFLVAARLSVALPPAETAPVLLQAPAGMLQVACFALGGEALRRGADVPARWRRRWLVVAVLAGAVLGLVLLGVEDERTSITLGTLGRSPALALAYLYCGWAFLRREGAGAGLAVWVTAGGFLLYGLNQSVSTAAALSEASALVAGVESGAFGLSVVLSDTVFLADMAWEACVGVGALLLLVEEKDRLYRVSRTSRKQFEALFEASADGILVADGAWRVRAANPAAREMLSSDEEEITGRPLHELLVEDDVLPSGGPEEIARRGGITLELTCRTPAGAEFPAELTLSAYDLEGRPYVQTMVRDISTRKALMDRLEHRATHDPLTDLPNRQYVFDELSRMIAMMRRGEARPGVFFLDLDRFKEINDSYGHPVGDELLEIVGRRLRETVRDTELVGHFGGDEFIVVVQRCRGRKALREVGRRLAQTLSEPFPVGDRELRLTASVGGALAHPDDSADALVERADEAMYRAKDDSEEGSGLVVGPEG